MKTVWRNANTQHLLTEKELIQACIREQSTAQEQLFRRYGRKLMGVALRYSRSQEEAEDTLQDAFIRIFDNLKKYKQTGSFEGWMRRIVINVALKKKQKKSYTHEITGYEKMPDSVFSPKAYSQLGEKELMGLVKALPDGYRMVFNLYAIEGYSHAEIAKMLGIGESTSRSQLSKARNILQEQLIELQKIAI